MQNRDNEKIIEICAEASKFNRKLAVDLIQAGAPLDMLQGLFHMVEMTETVAMRLGQDSTNTTLRPPYPDEYHHGVENLAKGMALAAEVLAPVVKQMTDAIAELKKSYPPED